jgi:ABC-2 type transport system permease protein
MLLGIAGFEIRYQLKNPVFWVSVAIFFLLGFGLTASENVSLGTPGSVHENAPYAIAMALSLMSLLYLFVITSFVANAIVRDDATGFGPMIRATSVTRNNFVLGRFLGGLIIAIIGYLSVPLGMAMGVMMPWVDTETVGPQQVSYYAWHFLIIALPNIVLASAFLFGLATTLRSMLATYIGVIIFVFGYSIATGVLGAKPEYQDLLARFEPLATGAIGQVARYWTAAEMNTRLIPFSDAMIFNRIFVILLAITFVAVTCWRFSMTERAPSKRALRKLAKAQANESKAASVLPLLTGGMVIAKHDGTTTRTQLFARLKTEIIQVLKSPGLGVLLFLAAINAFVALWFSDTAYGTPSHPLTANIIQTVRDTFGLFLMIVAVFYGGELVWRERDRKLNEIIDSTPVAGWVMIVPKILAVFVVLLIMNLGGLATGIAFQVIKGAQSLGIVEYFGWFIVPAAIDALLIAILAVFMQVISPNKYVGWGLMLVWFVSGIFLGSMGFANQLYRYAAQSLEPLSDMNGAGGFWIGAAWGRFYWFCFAMILMVAAHLLWPRGTDIALRPRFARIPQRLTVGSVSLSILALAGMMTSGLIIHNNIKNLNVYRTADDREKFDADYEKRYLKYEKIPQPLVTFAKFDAEIFPKERRLTVNGSYDLLNSSSGPISDVHVRQGDIDVAFPSVVLSGAKLIRYDKAFGYRIFRFAKPLAPGEKATLKFRSQIWRRGFTNGRPLTDVNDNGTFVNNSTFGFIIGMDRGSLLKDRTKRRRQGLPAEQRPAKLEDISAQGKSSFSTDWIMSDITVSTDFDQTPIAPGKKLSDTIKNGRRVAHFVSTVPVLNFFSIQSARYALSEQIVNGVRLSVFYHPAHKWNVPIMQKALATALDYYSKNFGPYQFDYARIIEFPRYQSFAQAFSGTMPYSEAIGFAADVTSPDSIDYVTFVTAHETAHQYWAHQVIGANMQGAAMTSETLAEYSALMVLKKIYGADKMRRFLKYELDDYLRGRQGEVVEELPLMRVEDQGYIHYNKGSLVMYLLQERLGEDAVNRALARFVQRFKFKGAPYHRSLDLITEFRKEAKTPVDQMLISDLFEKITVYDLKVKDAVSKRAADGQWLTTLTIEAHKYYADGKGVEKAAPLAEPIEVGLFAARPGTGAFSTKDVVIMSRQAVRDGKQSIMLKSKVKPLFAGIDPYNFYIDRDSDDNLTDVQ